MRRVRLPGTELFVSRFSFGTAGLFNAGTSKMRADLLAAAYDNGFTHYDTAPYYGFGTAESDLRPLMRAHPDITVATKVGIYSPGGEAQSDALVLLRKAAGKVLPSLSRPMVDWTVTRAKVALTASLRRLGREFVDLYLLHEPELSLLNTEEWLAWLESERDRVRYFGIAVHADRLRPFISRACPLAPVVQTLDSIAGQEANILTEYSRPMQITYGYVSAAKRAGLMDVPAVLAASLRRNATGTVIISTRKVRRLRQYAEISLSICETDSSPCLMLPRDS
ncbi:aldo/keto reductase [Bradyrhizobium sp. MOS002]|uniref:aldo/keto reductase n=1 Tax=Bradyrhizobium sp. MOS002 TaxID=2133947 RepID=UPI0026C49369|nr:aldo/keto reductase [Bradyrhizobium sp. MOS002]